MDIKILGPGCPKCKSLEELTKRVVTENGIDANVQKIRDIVEILGYGVASTPALVVDGEVKVSGRLPTASEINEILTKSIKRS